MIVVSERRIDPALTDDLPLGRTPDIRLVRDQSGFQTNRPALNTAWLTFLSIASPLVPPHYRYGVTFQRVLDPRATSANETHRDRDNDAINVIAFVTHDALNVQHEFFADADFWEADPIIIPNNHLIVFTKDLHRRPARPAGQHRKTFISASFYESPINGVCHGGVLG